MAGQKSFHLLNYSQPCAQQPPRSGRCLKVGPKYEVNFAVVLVGPGIQADRC